MEFWSTLKFEHINEAEFFIMNINPIEEPPAGLDNFHIIEGDVTDLHEYRDNTIDLCFSNSVIEHVGSIENKIKMANEMMRVGKHVYLQTPSFWFPFEPHFRILFFQWLPQNFQIWLLCS